MACAINQLSLAEVAPLKGRNRAIGVSLWNQWFWPTKERACRVKFKHL